MAILRLQLLVGLLRVASAEQAQLPMFLRGVASLISLAIALTTHFVPTYYLLSSMDISRTGIYLICPFVRLDVHQSLGFDVRSLKFI